MSSSNSLLPSERKTIADVRSFAREYENIIAKSKQDFGKKGKCGLWWDAYGMFKSSNKSEVISHIEKYRDLYEKILNVSGKVDKGDEDSFEMFLSIYGKFKETEIEAEYDAKNATSKTAYQVVKKFLSSKYDLNHKLKSVECILRRQKVARAEETLKKSEQAVKNLTDEVQKLRLDNLNLQNEMKENMAKLSQQVNERNSDIVNQNQNMMKMFSVMLCMMMQQQGYTNGSSQTIDMLMQMLDNSQAEDVTVVHDDAAAGSDE